MMALLDPGKKGVTVPNVLVTGASYGLGASVAAAAIAQGDAVYSMSRGAPMADQIHSWVEVDFADIQSIDCAASRLAEHLSGRLLDGVVLNAALADKSTSQWTVAQVERHFRVNTLAPFTLWSSLEDRGLLADPCNVVLVGSYLQNGNVRQPAYAMSKAALWSWMRSYTMRQPVHSPVSMNMVWPGRVDTPANPPRALPDGDPNLFYPPSRVAAVVLNYLAQPPDGPRGTVIDLGRS